MASDMSDSFEAVMDFDFLEEVAVLFAAFLAPSLIRILVEDLLPFDVPDAAYGVALALAAGYAPMHQNWIRAGGALYSVDKVAARVGIKQELTSMAQSAGGS